MKAFSEFRLLILIRRITRCGDSQQQAGSVHYSNRSILGCSLVEKILARTVSTMVVPAESLKSGSMVLIALKSLSFNKALTIS